MYELWMRELWMREVWMVVARIWYLSKLEEAGMD
jgi:hypothetical protein